MEAADKVIKVRIRALKGKERVTKLVLKVL
jgi:hypothetical protein